MASRRTAHRVGKGMPPAPKIQNGHQAVNPKGRNGVGRTGRSFGTTNQGRKSITSVKTSPTQGK